MESKTGLVSLRNKVLSLSNNQIEEMVLKSFGIGADVSTTENAICISVEHWSSCFKIMTAIRYDFDYDILKRGEKYILCIPKIS